MRRVATSLGIAVAVMLLMPWQICACSEDGPHLKVLWDRSDCEQAPLNQGLPGGGPADDGEDSEHDCEDLFFLAGTEAGAAVVVPAPAVGCVDVAAAEPALIAYAGRTADAWVVSDGFCDPGPSLLRSSRLLV